MSDGSKAAYQFRLFAPNNTEANVIGDWNDWQPVPMIKGDDGHFSVGIDLKDGVYRYKFNVRSKSWFNDEDAWVSIIDPYATDVDQEQQNSILNIKNGLKVVDEYEWKHDDVPLPENPRLVIYEMHVSDFSGGENDDFTRGMYTDVIAKLDYLADLGINAIELMPLKTAPGDFNWGYSPIHYFAPEPTYGTTAQLKELVDSCHALGIRVIVDGVYNHASTENPLTQIDHDYWFRREGKDPEQNWGPEFDYEKIDDRFGYNPASKFVNDSIKYWIYEYHVDGIRFDAAKQIDNFDALRTFVASGREMSAGKPFFTVAEYIPPTPEITEPDGPVESCWNDSFMYAMLEYLSGEPADLDKMMNALDPTRLGFIGSTSTTNYLANHDQNRLFLKLGEKGILDDELYTRAKLAATILMTSVGVPMIWMGEEFGEFVPMSESANKLNWTLLESPDNQSLHDHYKSLIRLRTTHPAFVSANAEFPIVDHENGVLALQRVDSEGNFVLVLSNLGDTTLSGYELGQVPFNGKAHDWLNNAEIELVDGKLTVDLPRRSAIILTNSE